MTEKEIERCCNELYGAGRQIMPQANVVDMLAVLGAMSAILFLHLNETHGIQKIAPIFEEWIRTVAETGELKALH